MKLYQLSIARSMARIALAGLVCADRRLPIWDGEMPCGLVLPGLAVTCGPCSERLDAGGVRSGSGSRVWE